MRDTRYGEPRPHSRADQVPCSTSVTSATRRNPAADSRAHHPHHCTVIHALVATHIDPLVGAAARVGDRLQLGNEFLDLDLGIHQIDLALGVHRDGERLLVLVEALGLRLRQIDLHADREQRCRHHEDDQQHQHHVDHRRDVDLGHDRLAGMPPSAPNARAAAAHAHRSGTPARRSDATGWPRIRRQNPPAGAPACSPRRRTCYRKSSPGWRQQGQLRLRTTLPRCRARPPRARYSSKPRSTGSCS